MIPIRNILHPSDFSDYSESAFQLACSIARDSGAKLIVLHVASPSGFVTHGEMHRMLDDRNDLRQELEDRLHRLQPAEANVQVEHLLVEGNPTDEILRVAEERKCDLIVIGTHGRTGFAKLLMGSVSEEILRRASCPVLSVRTPFREMKETTEKRREYANVQ